MNSEQLLALEESYFNFANLDRSQLLPLLEHEIAVAHQRIQNILDQPKNIDFDHIILGLEQASERVDLLSNVFYALHSADADEVIEGQAEKFSEYLTNFNNDIILNHELFLMIEKLYKNLQEFNLNTEQQELLKKYYQDFQANGAMLTDTDKSILRQLDKGLADLALKFSQNCLKATNSYRLHITNDSDIKGIPQTAVDMAKQKALAENVSGFIFTLHYPSYLPFITYCQNRNLRKEMYLAKAAKNSQGEFDNRQIVLEIIKLRHQRAQLLGFSNHAEYVLARRMAKNTQNVIKLLDEIKAAAMPFAKKELQQLRELAATEGVNDLQKWDIAYFSEKLKQQELAFDSELVRPYFKMENVLAGVFQVAHQLFDLEFHATNIKLYHPDVITYKVTDARGFVGYFSADFYPRDTKRSGAWMTHYSDQGMYGGKIIRSHVGIVCNFTPSTKDQPSLLSLEEVLTLFHEFGHALHGLLSRCQFRSIAGTNVLWDFVELPSQIMENWVLEKECLDLFAKHYQSGDPMPTDLVEKIKLQNQFLQGLATLRQLSFSYLDLAWHTTDIAKIADVIEFEKNVFSETDLLENPSGVSFSTDFSHIFDGGYSAGYYSYKWAEVLDADAFEYFQEQGIFNSEVARSFKENILEKGASEDPNILYQRFRGRPATSSALLKRAGLQ